MANQVWIIIWAELLELVPIGLRVQVKTAARTFL